MDIAVSVLKMVLPVLVMIIIGMILRMTKLVSSDGMSGGFRRALMLKGVIHEQI
ncbi:MAG: hypothetical protein IJL43_05105 [Lachnospiraceae bacterium]|nr:hypothetical protein [Lachnospiraceae bacterium]